MRLILVPIDGSTRSMQALESALEIAAVCDSRLLLLALVDPYPLTTAGPDLAWRHAQHLRAARQDAADALHAACQRAQAGGVPVDAQISEALVVWKGILDAARKHHADMVVMGSHSHGPLQRLVLGSVTHQVLQHARLPVLVVQEPHPGPLAPLAEVAKSEWSTLWHSTRAISERLAHPHRRH